MNRKPYDIEIFDYRPDDHRAGIFGTAGGFFVVLMFLATLVVAS